MGFSDEAAERLARACQSTCVAERQFADAWELLQLLSSCCGGGLVPRPDLIAVNADAVDDEVLDCLSDLVGELPVWRASQADLLAQSPTQPDPQSDFS